MTVDIRSSKCEREGEALREERQVESRLPGSRDALPELPSTVWFGPFSRSLQIRDAMGLAAALRSRDSSSIGFLGLTVTGQLWGFDSLSDLVAATKG